MNGHPEWQAQARAMADAWREAQQSYWRAWTDVAAPAGPSGAPSGPGMDLTAMWRRLVEETAAAWTAGAAPAARDAAAGLMNSQAAVWRFTDLVAQAWQAIAAQAARGEAWTEAVDTYVARLRQGWAAAPETLGAAGRDLTEMWRLYLDVVQRTVGPWGASLREAPGHFGAAATGNPSAFTALSRLYWDAWEHTGGRLLESPSLGATREFDEKLLRGFDAWMDHRRAVAEYQLVVADAWSDALAAVLRELGARAERGQPVSSLRDLTELWTTLTDAHMDEVFRSERYASAQGHMLNTAMIHRQRERAIAETLLKATDIPARSELDEAFKEIYGLRRELKALRQEVLALRGAHAGADRPTTASAATAGGGNAAGPRAATPVGAADKGRARRGASAKPSAGSDKGGAA